MYSDSFYIAVDSLENLGFYNSIYGVILLVSGYQELGLEVKQTGLDATHLTTHLHLVLKVKKYYCTTMLPQEYTTHMFFFYLYSF
jgi:hypothetical protein